MPGLLQRINHHSIMARLVVSCFGTTDFKISRSNRISNVSRLNPLSWFGGLPLWLFYASNQFVGFC